jgi:hypothetical protein
MTYEDPWADGYFDAYGARPQQSTDPKYKEGYKAALDSMDGKIEVTRHVKRNGLKES